MGMYRTFSAVLAVTGVPTDDGRMFAAGMNVSFRDFPLPLGWQKMSDSGHMSSYTVGVIEDASVQDGKILGTGYLLDTAEAAEAAQMIEHGVTGPSVDLGDVSWELRDANGKTIDPMDLWDMPMDAVFTEVVTAGKVLGATLVAIPAFGQTSITLGDMAERADAESATATVLASAAAIYSPPVYAAAFFTDPGFDGPTPLHITDDGRVQGHLAVWNTCHVGIRDRCVIAPHSETDYAHFHTAPPVRTDDGGKAKVGRLTVDCGHADSELSLGPAIGHYDNAGTCFALVHAGEDAHGIWVSGVPAPGVGGEQLARGLSAPLSGDWRDSGGNLELIAALSVNTPGFPVPVLASGASDDHDRPRSLVAALSPCREPAAPAGVDIPELARAVVAEMRADTSRRARANTIIDGYRNQRARALIARVRGV